MRGFIWLAMTLVSLPMVSCDYNSQDPAESISDDEERFYASRAKCIHYGFVELKGPNGFYPKGSRPNMYYCKIEHLCFIKIMDFASRENSAMNKVPAAFCDKAGI